MTTTQAPIPTLDDLPAVLTIRQVCTQLQIALSTYFLQVKEGRFPLQPIQPSVGHPRYRKADLVAWINGDLVHPRPRFFSSHLKRARAR